MWLIRPGEGKLFEAPQYLALWKCFYSKSTENIKNTELFYYLLTINLISSSPAGQIKKLHGPHMDSGP